MDWRNIAEPSKESNAFIAASAEVRWPSYKSGLQLVRQGRELCNWLWDADDEMKIMKTIATLEHWPAGLEAAQGVAATYRPLTARPADIESKSVGCSCGHDGPIGDKGAEIYSTVDDPIGGAEGIMHETGHLRLKTLGIDLESHDGRLLDHDEKPPHDLPSPIRKDVPRPVTAVLHAQYSYVMVVALDVLLGDKRHIRFNLPRIEEGLETLRVHAEWTDVGKQFFKGFDEWAWRTILEAQMIS